MSKSNAVTPASFQYINHRFAQKNTFISLSGKQLGEIEDAHAMFEAVRGFVLFLKNLIELEERGLIESQNEFWVSIENHSGIHRVIDNAMNDIGFCVESLSGIDSRLINEKALFDLNVAEAQFDLISSFLYAKGENKEEIPLEKLSYHRLIFKNVYSVIDRIYSELTVLYEIAQQSCDSRSESLEGVD